MKTTTIIIILLLISGWKANTHETIAETLYFSMPNDLQEKFNLTEMKEGSIAPDAKFKDFKNHHYPYSLEKTKYYLKNLTSYNFGIITHYISDAYAAPHNIKEENYKLHSWFEDQVQYYQPKTECQNYNIDMEDLKEATKNEKDWWVWLKRKDKSIAEKEVDESMKILYSLMFRLFPEFKCSKITNIETKKMVDNESIILLVMTALSLSYIFLKIN